MQNFTEIETLMYLIKFVCLKKCTIIAAAPVIVLCVAVSADML
jgi:hypothetical protein